MTKTLKKNQYELIARAFYDQLHNSSWTGEIRLGIEIMADCLADFLKVDTKFDRNKFLEACGVENKALKEYGEYVNRTQPRGAKVF